MVPPELAYGDRGAGDSIPGGSGWETGSQTASGGATLTFDVRLVQINGLQWSDEVSGGGGVMARACYR